MAQDNSPEQKEKLDQVLKAIEGYANELYELMKPGMVIDIMIPEQIDIIVPNQQPKMKRLIIMKPMMHLRIRPK